MGINEKGGGSTVKPVNNDLFVDINTNKNFSKEMKQPEDDDEEEEPVDNTQD